LLIIAYINELADVLSEYKVTVKIYADDLKLYAVLATDIDVSNFNSALKCIVEWANTWQLQLSEKCCIFEINKKHSTSPTFSFCLNGVSLPTTNIVEDLGITVYDSLTPCTHISKITATAHQRANLIVRSFTSRDIAMLLHAYTT